MPARTKTEFIFCLTYQTMATYINFSEPSDRPAGWLAYLVWGADGLALVGWARGAPMPRPEAAFAEAAHVSFGAQWHHLSNDDSNEIMECRGPALAVTLAGRGSAYLQWSGAAAVRKEGGRVVAFRSSLR